MSHGASLAPEPLSGGPAAIDSELIDAATAYFEYLFERYGRVSVYQPPLRTVLGFQASHIDTEFYERFYRPEALSETERRQMEEWHAGK